jgi:hypothetical protein
VFVFALELLEGLGEVTNALPHGNAPNKQDMKVVFFSLGARIERTEIHSVGNHFQLLPRNARFNKGIQRESRRNCDDISGFVFGFLAFGDPLVNARKSDALPVIFFAKDMILDADVG